MYKIKHMDRVTRGFAMVERSQELARLGMQQAAPAPCASCGVPEVAHRGRTCLAVALAKAALVPFAASGHRRKDFPPPDVK